ncbi:aldehyde dehydrogenase family protein [Chryseolinea lacunae]|uniref:Aldehyde dehydrogenase n=1 Tax=Chryseolinea lacunae TaxID=2801331 RepID=A0ABS1KUF4_9BACT|nr:aldehyde dehydrogenase family protein [Chryseolinea lacunae]MBL0741951.1 aldehyde dehydrogenase family protein [Chryseolinea lacunae]
MEAIANPSTTAPLVAAFSRHKTTAQTLRTEPLQNRKNRLMKLRAWLHAHRQDIHTAMFDDFRKNATEVDAIEIFHVLGELKYALQNVEQWSTPKKIDAPITLVGTRSFIQYEPRGVCLIISPWNYPLSLCLGPLVSALAAGNAVVIKPSEMTPHVSALIRKMVEEIFEPEVVSVFEGGPEVSQTLLGLPFDHIFFTGSPAIGKVVMKAAAENLASVTLELGGKSPVIVTDTARIKDAARRTAFTKFLNNGQTCLAPDYVLVDEKVAPEFTRELIEQTKKLFTETGQTFETSPHYCRIVNDKHFERLNGILQDAVQRGARIEYGGAVTAATRFVHPMILSSVPLDARVMEEEIFGPVLPVVPYANLSDALAIINSKPKALALYVFTNHQKTQDRVLRETSSGGVCVNDCGIHFMHHDLPFGGVNNSGVGKSHGHAGFLAFSNEKAVLKQRGGFTSVSAFYPPYTPLVKKLMDWFLKLF